MAGTWYDSGDGFDGDFWTIVDGYEYFEELSRNHG
jgi:endo-alpha-1,4-polygalactosaminidase (GH114 family)